MAMREHADYVQDLIRRFWLYRHSAFMKRDALFDPEYAGPPGPPVFGKGHAPHNVLVPDDPEKAELVLKSIPPRKRQTWFRSMRSSQALAQSVFGNLKAYNRVSCLLDVRTADGEPAFGRGPVDQECVELEHAVSHGLLGEPRPTNVDVWIRAPEVVCVECKFSESEVGQCSRPRQGNHRVPCNGNCEQQPGRDYRCALAKQGIRYWTHLPGILPWSLDEDSCPCRLRGPYQLVRNILAACVEHGHVDLNRGHALLVYDANNPAFMPDPDDAFSKLREQLVEPSLLRRVSWQSILGVMTGYDELRWLVNALADKYGLVPRIQGASTTLGRRSGGTQKV